MIRINWSLVAILILLWGVGMATDVTFGGGLHLVGVAAIVFTIMLLLSGRSTNSDSKAAKAARDKAFRR